MHLCVRKQFDRTKFTKMRKLIQSLLMCVAVGCLLSSCVSKKKFEQLMSDKTTIDQVLAENQEKVKNLETNVATLESEKEELGKTLEEKTSELSDEISAANDELMSTKKTLEEMQAAVAVRDSQLTMVQEKVSATFDVYRKGGFDLSAGSGGLNVNTPSPVRFRSGSTRVDQESQMVLNDLATKLKQNPRVKLLVEGHTDSVPMKEGARFRNNQELSTARANQVVAELVKMGVSPTQLTAAGRGDTMPKFQDENDSEEIRAMNRRTEFILLADVAPLFEMSKGMN